MQVMSAVVTSSYIKELRGEVGVEVKAKKERRTGSSLEGVEVERMSRRTSKRPGKCKLL